MKVANKSKQIELMRNTDCRERPNLYHVIDIGSIFNKIAKKYFTLELNCIPLNTLSLCENELLNSHHSIAFSDSKLFFVLFLF